MDKNLPFSDTRGRAKRANHGTVGRNRPQLQHLRPCVSGLHSQGIQLEPAGHGRLVQDHQPARSQRPPLHLLADRSYPEQSSGLRGRTGPVQLGPKLLNLHRAANSWRDRPIGIGAGVDRHQLGARDPATRSHPYRTVDAQVRIPLLAGAITGITTMGALVRKVGRLAARLRPGDLQRARLSSPPRSDRARVSLLGPSAALPGVDQLVSNEYWPVGNVHPDSFALQQ